MPERMNLRALLWDVDGTIAETERDGHRVAFNLAFAEAGLDWGWDERRYGELLQVTGGRERLLADMASRDDAPRSPERREALAADLHRRKNRHYARLVSDGVISARPGVLASMRQARADGLRQGIVTTTSRSNVDALMQCLVGERWSSWFELVICGEDVLRKKPDPEAYLRALERLKLPAREVVAIEDAAPGVAAATAAGLAVWHRPSHYFAEPIEQADVWTWLDGEMPWRRIRVA